MRSRRGAAGGRRGRRGAAGGGGGPRAGYAYWFSAYGWGVENYGVDPDVEVLITPDDWAAGRDPQLEVAVDRALELLAERPPAQIPGVDTGPVKRRPPLPPRP